MNWKRAKTLFIFVFILVNISLIIIYIDKVNKSHISESDSDNKVNFKQEEITIPNNLQSVKGVKMQLITARTKDFTDYAKNKKGVESGANGDIAKSDLDHHISVSKDSFTNLKNYIKNNVYKGDSYAMSDVTDDKVILEQTYNAFPIMNNNKARLTFDINKQKQATKYKQKAMESIKPSKGENNEKKQVISARAAIDALYYNRYLKHKDEVTQVRLGYYTVVKEPNVQVLEGNWEIKVKHKGQNKTKTYYVEAVSQSPKIIEE
ncbi:two-component system regulatory protein YycI [Staphylococcus kloosii]|uniref:two-component system regulatory protein YycI n=1 Tax=Staphylococcus kloosii TaxID=29384 RepID=UPI0028A37757|nr:two-component system regulatory protein YycI [Staphylococcus kloosii]MDT3959759.1 two-component system regulatory protein YycI [Staphylococcus kloosii]